MNDDRLRERLNRLEGSLRADFGQGAVHERHSGRLGAVASAVVIVVVATVGTMWTVNTIAKSPGAPPQGLATASLEAGAPVAEGCRPAETPADDPVFASVDERFGPMVASPGGRDVSDFGIRVDSLDEVPPPASVLLLGRIPSDLANELVLYEPGDVGTRWTVVMYLSPKPVAGTIADVMAAPAVQIVQKEATGQDAQVVAAALDESTQRYSIIKVGAFDALVHHADPVGTDDVRPWHIYWSDGVRDWSVVGNRDPVELIDLARSIYCGP
ncbi:MAG: hypothetical protein ABIO99_10200 [Candidatus Limnocylindria bacterium]